MAVKHPVGLDPSGRNRQNQRLGKMFLILKAYIGHRIRRGSEGLGRTVCEASVGLDEQMSEQPGDEQEGSTRQKARSAGKSRQSVLQSGTCVISLFPFRSR